jgi:hypothetical protein
MRDKQYQLTFHRDPAPTSLRLTIRFRMFWLPKRPWPLLRLFGPNHSSKASLYAARIPLSMLIARDCESPGEQSNWTVSTTCVAQKFNAPLFE